MDHGENNLQVCSLLMRGRKLLLLGTSALRCLGRLRDGRWRPRLNWDSYIPYSRFPVVFPWKEYLVKKKKSGRNTLYSRLTFPLQTIYFVALSCEVLIFLKVCDSKSSCLFTVVVYQYPLISIHFLSNGQIVLVPSLGSRVFQGTLICVFAILVLFISIRIFCS